MSEAKLRIGMQTIVALKKYDESAKEAYYSWIALAPLQIKDEIEVYSWVNPKNNRIETGLSNVKS